MLGPGSPRRAARERCLPLCGRRGRLRPIGRRKPTRWAGVGVLFARCPVPRGPGPAVKSSYCHGQRAGHSEGGASWPDEASASPAPPAPRAATSDAAATARQRGHHPACSPAPCARSRPRAQRGPVDPPARTKFQVVALLVREERARVKADGPVTEAAARRAAQAPRRRRHHPGQDRGPRHLAARAARRGRRRLRRGPVAQARDADGRRHRAAARGRASPPEPDGRHRREPSAGSSRSRSSRASSPTRSWPPTSRPPSRREPRPRRLATWELLGPLLPLLRARRQRRLGLHGAARADLAQRARAACELMRHQAQLVAAAAAGPPHLPARRRARPGQDRPGAARRAGRRRLPAAGRRAERRQDQLGARGRALDPAPRRPP